MATQQDPLLNMRQEASRRQQAADYQQILESSATPPPAPSIAPFSSSNDEALAAHLRETRERDAGYLKLQSEEARERYVQAIAENFRRTQAQAQEGAVRGAIEREQRGAVDQGQVAALIQRAEELTATLPPDWTPQTLPMDKLAAVTQLRQEINRTAAMLGTPGLADGILERGPLAPGQPQAQAQPQARPQTFPDGSLYQLTNLPDGNVEVRLITGEVFKGDPITVTRTIAESNVNTKRWAQQQRAQTQQQPQNGNGQTAQPQTPAQPTEQGTIADWWAEQSATALAKQFGFTDKKELLQWGETVNQKMTAIEQYENERSALQFLNQAPDFPNTDESVAAIDRILTTNRWDFTPENMLAAHSVAIRRGDYQPLTQDQIQAATGNAPQANRPTPPPMLRTNNPEISNAAPDPQNMPMDQLRKLAIKQELERSGAGYR